MRVLALTGWVAALAALLAAAALYADRRAAPPRADPTAAFAAFPRDDRPAAALAWVRAVAVTVAVPDGAGVDAGDVLRQVSSALTAGGVSVVHGPGAVPPGADGVFHVLVQVTPVASVDRPFLLQVDAILKREVVRDGDPPARVFTAVWMLSRPWTGDAAGGRQGATLLAAAHARQFAEHVAGVR